MRRKILTIFLSLVLLISFSFQGEAKEFTSQRKGLDVMFAIDSSGSMVSNDPGRVGLSMVKALIDTVHIENIRIGFTAYSDQIWSVCSPVPIEEASAREELKRSLDQIPYSGDTDMGLGIKTALEAMQEEAGRNRVLVVISDGETDLPRSSQRTEEQSMETRDLVAPRSAATSGYRYMPSLSGSTAEAGTACLILYSRPAENPSR